MAPLVDGWDYGSWSAVYNALSFGPTPIWSRAFSLLISARLNFSTGHFSVPLRCPLCCSHLQSSLRSSFLTSRRAGIAGMGSATIFFWSRSLRFRFCSRVLGSHERYVPEVASNCRRDSTPILFSGSHARAWKEGAVLEDALLQS